MDRCWRSSISKASSSGGRNPNPDYSYGPQQLGAFKQILLRYGIEAEFVASNGRRSGRWT